MSKEKLNIYQKINRVMARVGVVEFEDKRVNNQYTYLSHDAVVRSVRRQMVIEGIVMRLANAEMKQSGNRTELHADFHLVNTDNPEDFASVHSIGFGIDGSDKGPGKALSYAKKYALITAFLLEAGDSADVERFNIEHKAPTTITEEPKEGAAKPAPRKVEKAPDLLTVKKAFLKVSESKQDAASLWKHACSELEIDASAPSASNVLALHHWLENSFGNEKTTRDMLREDLLNKHLPAFKRKEK
tara:strand:+ start:915 stop:1646 length:732 start_codon:yes stop_codon:yes gene_type:complete